MSKNNDNVLARIQEIEAEEAENSQYKNYSRYKRPSNVRKVDSLKECYNWRKEVVKDCENAYNKLFDITLNEDDVRKYNDMYNEYMKELIRWDKHIVQDLNGYSYKRSSRLSMLQFGNNSHNRNGKRMRKGGIRKIQGKWYVGKSLDLPEIQQELKDLKESENAKETILNDSAFLKRLEAKLNKKEYYKPIPQDINIPETLLDQYIPDAENDQDSTDQSSVIPEFSVPSKEELEQWLVRKRKENLKSVLG